MMFPEVYRDVPRRFPMDGGRSVEIINEAVELEDGSRGIKNDVLAMKKMRHKVIISEVQQTPTKKIEDVQVIGELMQRIPPSKEATLSFLVTKSISLIDQLNPEDRETLTLIGDLETETIVKSILAKSAQADAAMLAAEAQKLQAQAMLMQAQAPQVPGALNNTIPAQAQPEQQIVPQGQGV